VRDVLLKLLNSRFYPIAKRSFVGIVTMCRLTRPTVTLASSSTASRSPDRQHGDGRTTAFKRLDPARVATADAATTHGLDVDPDGHPSQAPSLSARAVTRRDNADLYQQSTKDAT